MHVDRSRKETGRDVGAQGRLRPRLTARGQYPPRNGTSTACAARLQPPPPCRRRRTLHPGRWDPYPDPRSTPPRGVAIPPAESSTPRPDGRAMGKRAGVSVPRSPNLLVSLRGGAARNNVVGVVGISPSYNKLS